MVVGSVCVSCELCVFGGRWVNGALAFVLTTLALFSFSLQLLPHLTSNSARIPRPTRLVSTQNKHLPPPSPPHVLVSIAPTPKTAVRARGKRRSDLHSHRSDTFGPRNTRDVASHRPPVGRDVDAAARPGRGRGPPAVSQRRGRLRRSSRAGALGQRRACSVIVVVVVVAAPSRPLPTPLASLPHAA